MRRSVLLVVVAVIGLCSLNALPAAETVELVDEVYRLIRSYYFRTDEVSTEALVEGAIKGMIEALDDPYSEFMSAEDFQRWQEGLHGEFTGVGIEISLRQGKAVIISPLPDTPAERAGLRPGDIIVKVDGESIREWNMDRITSAIRGDEGTEVTLTVERDEQEPKDFVLQRARIRIQPVITTLLEEAPVAHIRMSRMSRDAAQELGAALAQLPHEELEGVILDLRRNPGGYLIAAVQSAAHFLEHNSVVLTTVGPAYGERTYRSRGNGDFGLPLVVLIDEGSASASEVLAGALQDHGKAVVIGRTSFGKGIIQELVTEFPDGSVIKLTTSEYYTPAGNPVHEKGITPDIEVVRNRDTEAPDEDPDIEAALQWIRENAGTPVGAP